MRVSTIGKQRTKHNFKIIFWMILITLFVTTKLHSQNNNEIKFERVGLEQGLLQSTVYTVFQDSKGFLWFGTRDGLHKYDGYGFKLFRNKPENANSLSNNTVRTIYEHESMLWVGTEKGLNKFDRSTEKFTRYFNDPKNPNSLSHDRIRTIVADKSGALWIGTSGGGLNKLIPSTSGEDHNEPLIFERYQHDPTNPASLSHNNVYSMYPERMGGIWVGTIGGGLNRLDTSEGTFTIYQHDPNVPGSLGNNSVNTVFEDKSGVLWVGTRGGGLDVLPPQSAYNQNQQPTFIHYKHDPHDPNSISNNNINVITEDQSGVLWIGTYGSGLDIPVLSHDILEMLDQKNSTITFKHFSHDSTDSYSLSNDLVRSIYEDQSGVLWVGTSEGGLNKFERKRRKFEHYQHEVNNPYSLSAKSISSIYEDRNGVLWIGTYGGGLNKLIQSGDMEAPSKFIHFLHDPDNPKSLGSDVVLSIYQDQSGTLWVGTLGGGLNRFNSKEGTFTRYQYDPKNAYSLSNNRVTSIHEEASEKGGVFWIGTYGGLNRFDRENGTFTHYKHDPNNAFSISHDNINQIYVDHTGVLWIATRAGGLNKFDREKGIFTRYLHSSSDTTSLSNDEINVIHESSTNPGLLWIGTYGGGLNKFDVKSGKFTHYREKDGLSNDVIDGILEDTNGNLWLSTNGALSKFNPSREIFRNYNLSDGLQSSEFNAGAFHKSQRSGKMFFGGINGFNAFYAEQGIEDDPYKPQIVITDFQIFNKSVPINKPNDRSPLQKSITETEEIILTYKESVFSFEFAALHYSLPEKNRYAYKMEGFDNDWNYIDNRRFTTFTALPAGEYLFRVKGSNPDGVWNEVGTSVKIKITPPWWKTLWAYSLYMLALAGTVFGYNRYRTQLHTKELIQERRVAERLRRVDKLKDEFLANTSHELRTPLHGIIGITESLLDNAAGEPTLNIRSNLSMVVASGKRLANLVNNILDFSKLKTHNLELKRKPINIRVLTDLVLKFSQPLLSGKKLELKNTIPRDIPAVDGDENRLQQILYNLIGNAIKFTDTGLVIVSATKKGDMVEVSISDTGIGISRDKYDTIFKSFEQADASTTREYGGTGLGLSITKQLVVLHGGRIWVESKVNKGSIFTFTLPLSEGIPEPLHLEVPDLARVQEIETVELMPNQTSARWRKDEISILVVEDEPVNQQVLANYLGSANYEVTQAFSGPEALNIIESEKKFDLVLLDIMMPRMSGYEVCQKIRESYLPSELPVIMITAKEQVSDLVEGFSVGANDYLAKPISKNELLARIKTHLNLYYINSAYGRFVPHEFLRSLGHESILEVKLGDQVQGEMTILFSDIRSYSTLSESMTPKENFNFLNAYLRRVGPVIIKHQGFVNQYYGDGIMALFPGNVTNAINASIEMQNVVGDYNNHRKKKGRVAIDIGVGLHTGSLMIGILGDEQRMNAGVVSDAVNTASRMEGLTKFYGASIIISEDTLSGISDSNIYNYRFLGKVQVKGKLNVVSVFEITDGDQIDIIELKMKTRQDFEKGLRRYFTKDFTGASVSFKKVLNLNPGDKAAELYLKRSAQLMVQGVQDEWEGIEVLGSRS